MGKRTYRDVVDTRLGIGSHCFERNTTRRFGAATTCDLLHRLASLLGSEVVEHNPIDTTRLKHEVDILQRANLTLYGNIFAVLGQIAPYGLDGGNNTSCEIDVVIFEQHHIEKTDR